MLYLINNYYTGVINDRNTIVFGTLKNTDDRRVRTKNLKNPQKT